MMFNMDSAIIEINGDAESNQAYLERDRRRPLLMRLNPECFR